MTLDAARHDLRCNSKLYAVLIEPDLLEVKCSSRWCGAEKGVVVLHRFSLVTQELVETLRYRDPQRG